MFISNFNPPQDLLFVEDYFIIVIIVFFVHSYWVLRKGENYMLNLTEDLYIGSGCHQSVYVHPDDKNLCVKVLTDTDPVIVKEEQRNRDRESHYLEKVDRKTPGCSCVVRFIGIEDTNLGEGAIYTLVRDANGEISQSLEECLRYGVGLRDNKELFECFLANLQSVLNVFKSSLLTNLVITRNIRPVNICAQKSTDGKIKNLILIDDLGPTEIIPISEYISVLAVSRIKRKWRKFINLLRGYSDAPNYQAMLDELVEK